MPRPGTQQLRQSQRFGRHRRRSQLRPYNGLPSQVPVGQGTGDGIHRGGIGQGLAGQDRSDRSDLLGRQHRGRQHRQVRQRLIEHVAMAIDRYRAGEVDRNFFGAQCLRHSD